MKIYYDLSHYPQDQRFFLNDITKALLNDRLPEERDQVYGEWVRGYESTPHIEEADIVLLTMKWHYYVDHNLCHLATEEIDNAAHHGKKIIVFSGGDHPANLIHPNVILFESGGYRSEKGLAYHSGLPFFTKNYLQVYCDGNLQQRAKSSVPVIGFCGQAAGSPLRLFFRRVRNQYRKLKYRTGRLKWAPPPFETTHFRSQVLKQFGDNEQIKTNFILRELYHAGNDQEKSDFSPQKMAFVNNILNSDYTVCMRGGGNFSIRFYETLALGRIPVFIDTDCLLPFGDRIPYRELFPWVEMKDLPHSAEILVDFHSHLLDQDFLDLQVACRKLWEDHFTPNGFHKDLRTKINELR